MLKTAVCGAALVAALAFGACSGAGTAREVRPAARREAPAQPERVEEPYVASVPPGATQVSCPSWAPPGRLCMSQPDGDIFMSTGRTS